MSETKEITLGNETFRVAEMPFGKVKKLLPLMGAIGSTDPMQMSEEQFGALTQILLVGISAEHPDVTAEQIDAKPIKLLQITSAIATITQQAGLVSGDAAGKAE